MLWLSIFLLSLCHAATVNHVISCDSGCTQGRYYRIDGLINPAITCKPGDIHTFATTTDLTPHPFAIKTAAVIGTGSLYTGAQLTGTNPIRTMGQTLTFTCGNTPFTSLYYICENHVGMTAKIVYSPGTASSFTPLGFLDALNTERAFWPVPALAWNANLAKVAQDIVETCDWTSASSTDRATRFATENNVPFGGSLGETVGENRYATVSTGTPTVSAWTDLRNSWTCSSNTCKAGAQCGLYTQVVWADTRNVGCGVADCTTGSPLNGFPNWKFQICLFNDAGNIQGQHPFGANANQICAHTPAPWTNPPTITPVPVAGPTPPVAPVPVPVPVAPVPVPVPVAPAPVPVPVVAPTPKVPAPVPVSPPTTPVPAPVAAPVLPPIVPLTCSSGPGTSKAISVAEVVTPHTTERAFWSIPDLAWDTALAQVAQEAACSCQWSFPSNNARAVRYATVQGVTYTGDRNQSVGENHGAAVGGPLSAISWIPTPRSDWDCPTNTCPSGDPACFAYTQMIWKRSTKLGCAGASCNVNSPITGVTNWDFLVCLYNEAGNYIGEHPFGTDFMSYCNHSVAVTGVITGVPGTPSSPSAPASTTGGTPAAPSSPSSPSTPKTPGVPTPGTPTPSSPSSPSAPASTTGGTPAGPPSPSTPSTPFAPGSPVPPGTPTSNPSIPSPSTVPGAPNSNPAIPGTPTSNPSIPSPSTVPGVPSGTPTSNPGVPSPSSVPGSPTSNPGTPSNTPGTPNPSSGSPTSNPTFNPGVPAQPGTPTSNPSIPSPSSVPGVPSPSGNDNSSGGGGLPGWGIALIVLGAILAVALLVAAAVVALCAPSHAVETV